MRMMVKPPPPRLPACGKVTASAKPVATAASTALPPARITSTPAALASALLLAIIAWAPKVAPGSPARNRHPSGNEAVRRAGTAGPAPAAVAALVTGGVPRHDDDANAGSAKAAAAMTAERRAGKRMRSGANRWGEACLTRAAGAGAEAG